MATKTPREVYEELYAGVNGQLTVISEIVTEDFPNPKEMIKEPTRYQVDAMKGLFMQLRDMIEGYERQG